MCVCSIPLPSEVNVVLRYYLDWILQLLVLQAYFTMAFTIVFFIIGVCIYIDGLVNDLKLTLTELKGDSSTMMRGFSTEIAFHNEMLE